MLSRKTTNTNFIVFGLTRSGLEPTIYCTRGEHANHYTSDAVIVGGKRVKIPKGVIRIRKSTEDRQNSGQTEKEKRTNNDLQKNYIENYRLCNTTELH